MNYEREDITAQPGNVVAFPARPTHSSTPDDPPPAPREAATLILSLTRVDNNDGEYRIVGVNDSLPLGQLIDLASTCFGQPLGDQAGAGIQVQPLELGEDVELEPMHLDTPPTVGAEPFIGDVLKVVDDSVFIRAPEPIGVEFIVSVMEAYLRDAGTPDALCIGGDGASEIDVGAINATLTGAETMQAVLATARPELRELITRSGMFDFVPLLQALDLSHEIVLPPEVMAQCQRMPRERDPLGFDAALVQLMCQATPIDEILRADICVTTMAALGWRADDGSELTIAQIDAASATTLTDLYHLGLTAGYPRIMTAAGEKTVRAEDSGTPPTSLRGLSAVDRLEVCRAILADHTDRAG